MPKSLALLMLRLIGGVTSPGVAVIPAQTTPMRAIALKHGRGSGGFSRGGPNASRWFRALSFSRGPWQPLSLHLVEAWGYRRSCCRCCNAKTGAQDLSATDARSALVLSEHPDVSVAIIDGHSRASSNRHSARGAVDMRTRPSPTSGPAPMAKLWLRGHCEYGRVRSCP